MSGVGLACWFPYLFDLLDLLITAPNHIICRIRHLFHFHEADQRVHLGWQKEVKLVAVVTQSYTNTGSELACVNVLVYIDDVFALWVNLDEDLAPSHYLAWMHVVTFK
jgi:hypothetical protein